MPFLKFSLTPNKLIYKIGLLTALFFVSMGGIVSYLSYQNNIKNWQNELDSLTLVNAEHAKQILLNGNRVLDNLIDVIEASKIQNESEYLKFAKDIKQYKLLKDKTEANSILDVVTFTDKNGNVINFSRSFPPPPINLSDRDYFKHFKKNNDKNTFFSNPVKNRGNGEWVFYQVKRVNDKNDNLIGMVLVGISAKVFSHYYEILAKNFDSKVAFALYKGDHTLMSRFPYRENLIGKVNLDSGAKRILDLGKNYGNLILVSPRFTEQNRIEERFVGVRKLDTYPFYVSVTANKDYYLTAWKDTLWWVWSLTGIGLILVIVATTQIAKVQNNLQKELKIKNEIEKELFKSKEELEIRVNDRTNALMNEIMERKLAQQELIRINSNIALISHRAGKLEVVNSTLHNVGNILNSLNISISMLREKLAHSPIKKLPKLNELIHQHKDDLSHFLTQDEKGKMIPEFIHQMTIMWQKNFTSIENESQNIVNSIQHINEIISRYKYKDDDQHSEVGTQEVFLLSEIIDSTLLIASPGLIKTGIKLMIENETDIAWVGDRIKLSQILLNLLLNAKDALLTSEQKDRKIMLSSTLHEDMVVISVKDNGSGIETELLPNIFSYGFTTKPTGHGFGLHSSALAAVEMGGKLEVSSPGINMGAEFILTIPQNITRV